MKLREFIRENRSEIDAAINGALSFTPKEATCSCPLSRVRDHHCGGSSSLNDEERRQWVLNDEGLYNWARSEGVRI